MFRVSARHARVGEFITSDGYHANGRVCWEVVDTAPSYIKLLRYTTRDEGLIPVSVSWETVYDMYVLDPKAMINEVVVCSADYMSSDELTDEDKAIITEKLQ